MTELPQLPELPAGLPREPGSILQGVIPDRVIPMLVQHFAAYVAKIEVKIAEFVKADGTVLPAETLTAKLISSSVDSVTGELHEYYVLFARGGDPEGFMDFIQYEDGKIDCAVSRSCAAAVEIYYDGVLQATFPQTGGVGLFGPWIGYMPFRVYTPEA